ncbi:MAG: RtcB family protein [Solimicrobium sp.]|jgi:hypothetical protein|nr:RtcB family protein [Solimicrobium sp.]
MSRSEAERRFTVDDHIEATQGVRCRTDADVIDETPAEYKNFDAVMTVQSDLVEIVHRLRQVVCVKGERMSAAIQPINGYLTNLATVEHTAHKREFKFKSQAHAYVVG